MRTIPATDAEPTLQLGAAAIESQASNENSAGASEPFGHLRELDGWRGISILAVLACHLLPLGPPNFGLNYSAGLFGMAIFFCLSGFLITSFLLRRPDIQSFAIRRLFRILPLAYLYLIVVLPWYGVPLVGWLANFGFVENYLTEYLIFPNAHFWSLCVEMQFYLAIALTVLILRRFWKWTIPVACIVVTGLRIWTHTYVSINTHLRVDEILVGGCLALLYNSPVRGSGAWPFQKLAPPIALTLLVVSTLPISGPFQYTRPYCAALAVGCVLFQPTHWMSGLLRGRILRYCAEISYALYVVHPITTAGWLGTGPLWVKYLIKRPLSLILTFALAHLSTFHWEAHWIAMGKRLTPSRRIAPAVIPAAAISSAAIASQHE